MNKKSIFIFYFCILFWHQLLPWGAATHQTLVDQSVFKSIPLGSASEDWLKKFNLDRGFFYKYFNFNNEPYDLIQMITKGAVLEDNKVNNLSWRRSDNHFHNPLLAFASAGLNDVVSGLSLTLWAQDGPSQEPYPEKDQSWKKTREFYYNALVAGNENDKTTNLGNMFKGIGHQIHLVQDASVPDHVRNDTHFLNGIPLTAAQNKYSSFRCIEGWADWNTNLIYRFSDNPIFPSTHFNHILYTTAIPFSNLIDSNIYDGTNPSVGSDQGLAEYTNTNFISEDTICTNNLSPDHKHYFPFPKFSSTDLESVANGEKAPEYITAFDNKQDYVRYIKKIQDGATMEHFLKLGYFSTANPLVFERSLFIDDLCHKDFASMLVPRAVGYSAALINYFFRGEIEVTLPVRKLGIQPPQIEGIYSLCMDPTKGFDRISLMVKNITRDNEEMKNGQVSLVVSYRTCSGNPFLPNPSIPDIERYYKVVRYAEPTTPDIFKIIDIPRDIPIRLEFNLTSSPLPATAVDIILSVVFKGDLGAELTNAIGIGFKDISEPTPIDLFNNSDKVCFNNNYVNYDDAALWDAVDINPKNGKIDCLNYAEIDITRRQIWPIFLSFNGAAAYSENYYFQFENGTQILPGDTPKRIYVLADAYPSPINLSVFTHTESMDNDDDCSMYSNDVISFNAYTNKLNWISSLKPEECRYEHVYSLIGSFRGFPVWNLGLFENSKVPSDSVCSMPASANVSSSSASSISKSLGNPRIITISPKKKSE
jgi:hypothetical protein